MDELIIDDLEFDDLPGDLRGDVDDFGTDATVAGPGRVHVVPPKKRTKDQRDDQDDQRC